MHGKIVATIGRGVWDYVAAEAAGISRRTFYAWLAKGEAGEPVFLQFLHDVRQARAEARAEREAAVAQHQPLAWLRMGPGRDKPGQPGWTDTQQHEVTGSGGGPLNFTLIIERPAGMRERDPTSD